MDIEIKKSKKPIKYEDAIKFMEQRLLEINENNFEEVLKYKKKDFIKVKALQGDKSDNIPGLKGFGKVKIDKFLSGSVTLTEEETQDYERNLKLVK